MSLDYIPSLGNFVSVRVGEAGPVYQRLLRQGVIVRPVAGYGMPEHLRVTIGLESENARFLHGAASRRCTPDTPLSDVKLRKLAVFGVGLVGGSFAQRSSGRAWWTRVVGRWAQPRQPRARARAGSDRRDRRRRARRRFAMPTSCWLRCRSSRPSAFSRDIAAASRAGLCGHRRRQHQADVVAAARRSLEREARAVRARASDRRRRALRRGGATADVVSGSPGRADAAARD